MLNPFLHDHYHAPAKGCDITTAARRPDGMPLQSTYCRTHKVWTCRCGFEYEWHLGVYLKETNDHHNGNTIT